MHQSVVQTERQYGRESRHADSLDLTANSFPDSSIGFVYDHDSTEVGKRREPTCQARLVERIVSVTDEQRPHPGSRCKAEVHAMQVPLLSGQVCPETTSPSERRTYVGIPGFHRSRS